MNQRATEISELYTRIIQLELLKSMSPSSEASDAIQDHLALLRRRLIELKHAASIKR
jgi:hypothetical protein